MNKLIIIVAHIILIVLVVIVTFGCEREPDVIVINGVSYNPHESYVRVDTLYCEGCGGIYVECRREYRLHVMLQEDGYQGPPVYFDSWGDWKPPADTIYAARNEWSKIPAYGCTHGVTWEDLHTTRWTPSRRFAHDKPPSDMP